MALEIGALLYNRYRIDEVIAMGGMGAVYAAHDESLGVKVAVKENLFITEEGSRQFHREATLLAGLRHPNLPRVTDHAIIPGQGQYLVMDFIEGDDLRVRMAHSPAMSDAEAVLIGSAVCDALTYLHSRQPSIVHRDIKPGNVKVTPTGQVYLVDFGLAKTSTPGQQTTTGAQALTPGYAPPEQYGQGTFPQSDLYALGATLYAALSGKIPEDALARAMGSAQLTPLRKHNPEVPERLASVIEKAMAIRPEQRYPDAESFKLALLSTDSAARQQVAAAIQVQSTAQPAPPAAPPPGPPLTITQAPAAKRGLPWGLIAGALVLVAAAVVLFTVVLPGMNTPTPVPTLAATTTAPPAATTTLAAAQPSATQPAVVPASATPKPALTNTALPPTATFTPAATPLGGSAELVYVSDQSGTLQLWLITPGGGTPRQLTNLPDGACQPDWSPDGKRLIFVSPCRSRADTYRGSSLWLLNADGTGLSVVPSMPGGDFDPAWAPDGERIAFVSVRDGAPKIYLMNLKDFSVQAISKTTSGDTQPSWSPDGKQIAFSTTRLGKPQIWLMDDKGGQLSELTLLDDNPDSAPVFSPDGKLVYFSQGVGLPYLVAKLTASRQAPENKVTDLIRPVVDARFSRDGLWLAFESWPDGASHDIYLMTSSGGSRTRLTSAPGQEFQPVWRP